MAYDAMMNNTNQTGIVTDAEMTPQMYNAFMRVINDPFAQWHTQEERIRSAYAAARAAIIPWAVDQIEADRVLAVEYLEREMEAWTGSEDIRAAVKAVNRLAVAAGHHPQVYVVDENTIDVALQAWNRARYEWSRTDPDNRDEPQSRVAMRAVVTALRDNGNG